MNTNKTNDSSSEGVISHQEFEQRLRAEGSAYHIHHPYNVMLNTGQANREQIRGWVANRFYYQQAIPLKDGAVLAACDNREIRREWIKRILDHDGNADTLAEDPGGCLLYTSPSPRDS